MFIHSPNIYPALASSMRVVAGTGWAWGGSQGLRSPNPAGGRTQREQELAGDTKGDGHPRPQEQPLQRPGGGRQRPSRGPAGQHGLQSSSWGPPSMPRPVPSRPESRTEAEVALPGPPPPSFGRRAWKYEPDSGRGMGSSFVNGAICMVSPGTDGRSPWTLHPHLHTPARVSARGHTWCGGQLYPRSRSRER